MILSEIKQYLSQRGSASLSDISVHFDTDPNAMRGMLEQWIRKGKVSKHIASESCGSSCNKCDIKSSEIYQWVETTKMSFQGTLIKTEHCDQ